MKIYTFTRLVIVVMAQDYDSDQYTMQVQESIGQPKYNRVQDNCDDDKFNKNIEVPNKLVQTSQISSPLKFILATMPIKSIPSFANYIQNRQQFYMNDRREQYAYKRPTDYQQLGHLPRPHNHRQRHWIHNMQQEHIYNPIVNSPLKQKYINNIASVYSKNNDLSQHNSYGKTFVDYYKQRGNANVINCNNGYCTLCIYQQCRLCNPGMGKCEICYGGTCNSVNT